MKLRYILFIAGLGLALYASSMEMPAPAQPAPAQAETITLVSNEGQEFQIPKDIALQAGQIEALLANPLSGEAGSNTLEFKNISSSLMEDLAQFMWALYYLPNLTRETAI